MTSFPETQRAWRRLKAAWADYQLARRQHKAIVRLNRLVEQRKAQLGRYPQRRAAAKLGWQRRKASA